MLTVVLQSPGELAADDRPVPAPRPGEALVCVHRIGVCGTDLHAFAGRQPFFTYPRILGHELAVEVVDPGTDPNGLEPGDRCAVEPYLNCGRCLPCRSGRPNCCVELNVLGVHVDGGMRPLLAVPARKLHRSRRLDFEALALVETLVIGAHAVSRSGLHQDEFALVVGAGPIGLSVVQSAQAAGARLAVMDTNEARLAFCRDRLGIQRTVNPQACDVRQALAEFGDGDQPAVVFDATGNAAAMRASFELPANGGRLVFVGLVQGEIAFNDPSFHRRELTILASRNGLPDDFRTIIEWIEAGRIDTAPWITHRMDLAEVPLHFSRCAHDPALLKAMIAVSGKGA